MFWKFLSILWNRLLFSSPRNCTTLDKALVFYWKIAGVSDTQIKTMLFPWEVEVCGLFESVVFFPETISVKKSEYYSSVFPFNEEQEARCHQALRLAWPIPMTSCQEACSKPWHLRPELGNHTVVTLYPQTRGMNKSTINEVLKMSNSNTVLPATTGTKTC